MEVIFGECENMRVMDYKKKLAYIWQKQVVKGSFIFLTGSRYANASHEQKWLQYSISNINYELSFSNFNILLYFNKKKWELKMRLHT